MNAAAAIAIAITALVPVQIAKHVKIIAREPSRKGIVALISKNLISTKLETI